MQICQVVGYKNTGKTIVTEQIIQYYTAKNLRIGSLKHHGHGGDVKLGEDTDSVRHFRAGAAISGVQGESITQFTLHNTNLDGLIQMAASMPLDLLVLEGYKKAEYAKIVLVKNWEELALLKELSSIIAVGSKDKEVLKDVPYPTFEIKDIKEFLPSLMHYIEGRRC